MKKSTLLCILFTLIGMTSVFAQAGIMDNTYGNGGKVATRVGPGNSEIWSMAMQDDWSVVVGGFAYNGIDSDFALSRYTPNGNLDSTFGNNGQVITDMNGGNDVIYSIALQPDGKILAAGIAWNGTNYDFAIARYTNDGSLDAAFGNGGKVITAIGTGNDKGTALGLLSDWTVVVGGSSNIGSTSNFALVKYKTDGSLDSTFGNNGKVVTPMGPGSGRVFSLAVQSDWSVVMGGHAFNGTDYDFALARYKPNGDLDSTFGTNGKVFTAVGDSNDLIWSVMLQADGKVLAGGYSTTGTDKDFALVRYNVNGTLDNSFGLNGKSVTDMGSDDEDLYSLAIQPDGKIVAGGAAESNGMDANALVRYNTDGSIDNNFGTSGKVVNPLTPEDNEIYAIKLQPDGKIVTSGYGSDSTKVYFSLARYMSDLNLGVVDFSVSNNSLFIYPNPVAQNAVLQYTLVKDEPVSIRVVDMQGRTVKTIQDNKTQTTGEHKQALDLSNLAAGTYLIELSSTEGQMSIKIVK